MRQLHCVLSIFTCLEVIFAAEVTIGIFFFFIGKGVAIGRAQTMCVEAYNYHLTESEKGNRAVSTFHSTFQCCETKALKRSNPQS